MSSQDMKLSPFQEMPRTSDGSVIRQELSFIGAAEGLLWIQHLGEVSYGAQFP